HAHSCSRLGLTGVPLPLLSRLALGKIAELERPRRHPKALGTTSNLLSGSPSSIPCSRSDTCRAMSPSLVGLTGRGLGQAYPSKLINSLKILFADYFSDIDLRSTVGDERFADNLPNAGFDWD